MLAVKPKVIVNNNLVGATLGDDVEIECLIEAYPQSITYWKRTSGGSEIILMDGYVLLLCDPIRNIQTKEAKLLL